MINIISWISVGGIAVGTMALIIVLSAFNGLATLVEDLYASFDPDIKITLVEGKTFNSEHFPKSKILMLEGVEFYNAALEEVALIKYNDKQTVATIKGVENSFYQISGIDSLMIEGDVDKTDEHTNSVILGWGIADQLALYIADYSLQVNIVVPKKGINKGFLPGGEFNRKKANATGVFSISPDFDSKYVVGNLAFVQNLLQQKNNISSVELGLKEGTDWKLVKQRVQKIVGNNYHVKTRYELNELLFKTNKTEKWITFLILAFILVIASFNIIGALTMLIIDKQKDVWILKTMGANNGMVRQLFFIEGMLINLIGASIGMAVGGFVCWLQMQFGLLRLNGGVVDFYPIELNIFDFFSVSAVVILIGLVASWYPVRVLTKKYL